MAFGAQRRDVLQLILWQGLTMALSGVAFGLGCSVLVKPLVASQLFGVGPLDSFTLISVSLLLFLVAMTACYLPARHAMRVDPMIALRYE